MTRHLLMLVLIALALAVAGCGGDGRRGGRGHDRRGHDRGSGPRRRQRDAQRQRRPGLRHQPRRHRRPGGGRLQPRRRRPVVGAQLPPHRARRRGRFDERRRRGRNRASTSRSKPASTRSSATRTRARCRAASPSADAVGKRRPALYHEARGPLAQLVEQGLLIPRSLVRFQHGPLESPANRRFCVASTGYAGQRPVNFRRMSHVSRRLGGSASLHVIGRIGLAAKPVRVSRSSALIGAFERSARRLRRVTRPCRNRRSGQRLSHVLDPGGDRQLNRARCLFWKHLRVRTRVQACPRCSATSLQNALGLEGLRRRCVVSCDGVCAYGLVSRGVARLSS